MARSPLHSREVVRVTKGTLGVGGDFLHSGRDVNASMSKRIPGEGPGKLERGAVHLKRAAVVGLGVGTLLLFSAAPSGAAVPTGKDIAPGDVVSQASGAAVDIRAGGQAPGGGSAYVAVNDGTIQQTTGAKVPELPVVGNQSFVAGGAIGQDAVATSGGLSAACAGVVGGNGQVQLGPDNTCLITNDGQVRLSLGSIQHLGLDGQLLDQLPVGALPDLPIGNLDQLPIGDVPGLDGLPVLGDLLGSDPTVGELPDVQLQFVGNALTANCLMGPDGPYGTSSPVKGQVVAVVDGQRIPVANVPPKGVTLDPVEILGKVQQQLPPEAGMVLDQVLSTLPTDQLDALNVVDLKVGEKTIEGGQISITALGVEANYTGAAASAKFGHVTCGPNMPDDPGPSVAGSDSKPGVKASGGGSAELNVDDKASASVEGKAELNTEQGKGKGELAADANLSPTSTSSALTPIGWGTAAAILLTGLGIAGTRLLRSRRPVGGSNE